MSSKNLAWVESDGQLKATTMDSAERFVTWRIVTRNRLTGTMRTLYCGRSKVCIHPTIAALKSVARGQAIRMGHYLRMPA